MFVFGFDHDSLSDRPNESGLSSFPLFHVLQVSSLTEGVDDLSGDAVIGEARAKLGETSHIRFENQAETLDSSSFKTFANSDASC